MSFRTNAQDLLMCAKKEIGTGDDQRLKHAALELRMAMEALTYDRAMAYKDEFPPDEYETWQPRKVMKVLLDIDPTADQDCSLAVGIEEEYGTPAPVMNFLGSEKVLNMGALSKHYDALGSYLHAPSIKQVRTGKPLDLNKLRSRCDEIIAFVEEALASSVFNITMGNFATLDCMDCGKPVRKRIPHGHTEVHAECFGCNASYTLTDKGNGQIEWKPHQHEVECANKDCDHKIIIWRHELKVGNCWTCPKCNGRNTIVLGINYDAKVIC